MLSVSGSEGSMELKRFRGTHEVAQQSAIDVLLRHGAFATGHCQQMLCSMASVCKEWRAAVQQLGGRTLDVEITYSNKVTQRTLRKTVYQGQQTLESFATWLPKHGGLVHSLSIMIPAQLHNSFSHFSATYAEEQLAKAVDSCFGSCNSTKASCSGTPALQQQHSSMHSLQLQSYSSNFAHGSKALAALSTLGLKQLEVSCVEDPEDFVEGLKQLHDLEFLQIHHDSLEFVLDLEPATGSLNKLTELVAQGINDCITSFLPPQLQRLLLCLDNNTIYNYDLERMSSNDFDELDGWYGDRGRDRPQVSEHHAKLQHLTQLTSLELSMPYLLSGSLPTQLKELTIITWNHLPGTRSVTRTLGLTTLRQLQRLAIRNPLESAEELLELGCLPELQHLALDGCAVPATGGGSAVWSQVKQLKRLNIDLCCVSSRRSQQVLQHATAVGGLTSLAVYSGVDVCIHHIARLSCLQDLALVHIEAGEQAVAGDIQHLSVLTGLTRLKLTRLGKHVTEASFAALAANLRLLQQLELDTDVDYVGMMKTIGSLTGLKHLSIEGLDSVRQQRWSRYLTALKQLTTLQGIESCPTLLLESSQPVIVDLTGDDDDEVIVLD